MRTVTPLTPISLADLREMAAARFGDLVKAVVDLERRLTVVDAEMHSLEFDSMINLRPSLRNRSRSVVDSATRERISEIVRSLVQR